MKFNKHDLRVWSGWETPGMQNQRVDWWGEFRFDWLIRVFSMVVIWNYFGYSRRGLKGRVASKSIIFNYFLSKSLIFCPNHWFSLQIIDFLSKLLILSPNHWSCLQIIDFLSKSLIFSPDHWFSLQIIDFLSKSLIFSRNHELSLLFL